MIDAFAAAAGLVDLTPDTGIAVQNADGEIVLASAQAQAILGLTFSQMRDRSSQDPRWAAVDEYGRPLPGAQHPSMRAVRSGATVTDAVMGVHRPGSEAPGHHVWLDITAVPLFRPGETEAWVAVVAFRPITGHRLRELQLRDSERVHRMIAEHSSDMVSWQLLDDLSFLWVSPASRAVLGVDPDDLIGSRCHDLIHPDDHDGMVRWHRALSQEERPPRWTARMRHADGGYRWVETTAHVLPGQRGVPAQIIATCRDVTDRVNAESARDAAVRVFELAMAHSTVGMALSGVDGTIERVNPALCALLGRTAEELVGHGLWEFTADRELASHRDQTGTVLAGEVAHHEAQRRYYRPDGTTVWCIRTVIGLPGDSGDVNHLLVQFQDITAAKEATARLRKAAVTDALTGLPNRTVLEDRLGRALASARITGTQVGVLFIDIDRFKQINDTLGHEVGDHLLREAGIRLGDAIRHTDTVVRLGGDEFVVVREQLSSTTDLDGVTERIREAFAAPFAYEGHRLVMSVSVGAAAGNTMSARELLARADAAMYRVKANRGDRADGFSTIGRT